MKRACWITILIVFFLTACGGKASDNNVADKSTSAASVTPINPSVEWITDSVKSMGYEIPKDWECEVEDNKKIYYPLGKNANRYLFFRMNYWTVDDEYREEVATTEELEAVLEKIKEEAKAGEGVKDWVESQEEYEGRPAFHASHIRHVDAYDYSFVWYVAMISDREVASFTYVRHKDTKDEYSAYFDKTIGSLSKSDMEGFEYAEFERFNSYASENGLGDTPVYIDGKIERCVIPNEAKNPDTLKEFTSFFLTQGENKKWIVNVGQKPLFEEYLIEEIAGKNVRVFGVYTGFSDVFKMPVIQMTDWDKHCIETFDGTTSYCLTDFIPEKAKFLEWYHAQEDNDVVYQDRMTSVDNNSIQSHFRSSVGLIESVSPKNRTLNLIQKTEDGFVSDYLELSLDSDLYYAINGESIDLDDLNQGDSIRVYYWVSDNTTIFVAIEEAELPFSEDDIKQQYYNQCNSYKYEDIARNPDKVKGEYAKISGKVVQVIEDGSYITLRVNITPKGYGYYSDTIYVTYKRRSSDEDRILDDDIVTMYGVLNGTKTYTTTMGSSLTIPYLIAEYIDVGK